MYYVVSYQNRIDTNDQCVIGIYDDYDKARGIVLLWLFEDTEQHESVEGYFYDEDVSIFTTNKTIFRIDTFEMNTPMY